MESSKIGKILEIVVLRRIILMGSSAAEATRFSRGSVGEIQVGERNNQTFSIRSIKVDRNVQYYSTNRTLLGSPYCRDNGTDIPGDVIYRTIVCDKECPSEAKNVADGMDYSNYSDRLISSLFLVPPRSINLFGPKNVFHGDNITLVCKSGPSSPSKKTIIVQDGIKQLPLQRHNFTGLSTALS